MNNLQNDLITITCKLCLRNYTQSRSICGDDNSQIKFNILINYHIYNTNSTKVCIIYHISLSNYYHCYY